MRLRPSVMSLPSLILVKNQKASVSERIVRIYLLPHHSAVEGDVYAVYANMDFKDGAVLVLGPMYLKQRPGRTDVFDDDLKRGVKLLFFAVDRNAPDEAGRVERVADGASGVAPAFVK